MNRPSAIPTSQVVRAVVFGDGPGDRYRSGHTLRALERARVDAEEALGSTALAKILSGATGPLWLVRAGAWPVHPEPVTFPGPSESGRAVCALGLVRPEPGSLPEADASHWLALRSESGGDFSSLPHLANRLPLLASAYLETPLVEQLACRLPRENDLMVAFRAILSECAPRIIHSPVLDVHYDRCLRVVQVVTTLQRGGAERIALDLASELTKRGIRSLLVALGRPTRAAFSGPSGTIDLSEMSGDRHARLEAAARMARNFAADLVHGHLLNGDDVGAFAAQGLPLMLTVHNARPGWPRGLETLQAKDAALLVACSQAVEADLRAARLPIPVRTAWNGIDFAPFERTPALLLAAREFREQWGLDANDFVLVALANPRPQKRLERLPAILAATQAELDRRGVRRKAHLLIAGEASHFSEPAALAEEALSAEITRLGLMNQVHRVGAIEQVPALLAASDVLVSCSAYEGLSLAHLEALAAGLPVVATNAGGTAEIAHDNPALFVLSLDAGPDLFAKLLSDIAERPPVEGRTQAAVHFTQHRMVEGYARLYPRAVEKVRARQGDGLLLIINNFSTGGAQSSARRLLVGFASEGVRVRAAVLEEEAEYPTPGRRDLIAAGVPVLVLPPAGTLDPALAVAELLEHIDSDPPQAVLLWNAITEYKMLLVDGLLDVPIFDISPGEMYFTSLARYFSRPRPGLPYRCGADYGRRLAGAIVKYQAEAARAAETLGTAMHVISNGVPVESDYPRNGRPKSERLVIGTAARISPQKKLEELLQSLHGAKDRLPPFVLRIAGGIERGSNGYAEELKQLADGLPVEWIGEPEDVRPFLRDLDLFAMISEPAGCPNASLEAMAEGLAVVATDVGGASEQVVDGITGRLVPREDSASLAEALVELARDPALRAQYGAAGRRRVAALFDVRRMIADYRRVCLG